MLVSVIENHIRPPPIAGPGDGDDSDDDDNDNDDDDDDNFTRLEIVSTSTC